MGRLMSEQKSESAAGCAIVVGVGPGLGRSLGLRFAAAGYNVALISRSKNKTEPVAKAIAEKYKSVNTLCLECDTSKLDECSASFKEITAAKNKMGRVEVLCFYASVFSCKPFLEMNVETLEKSFNVGVKGLFIWSQLVLPDMIKNDKQTSILITGATAGLRGSAKFASFAMSKFGIRAISQSLAREFHPKGVHVAHFIIDGTIGSISNQSANDIAPDDIADSYYFVHRQPKSCWTQEMDLRPNVEKF